MIIPSSPPIIYLISVAQSPMRPGLLFNLLRKKPNILAKEKEIYKFTFLQSQCLNESLTADASTSTNQSILEFLQTPFHFAELHDASFLRERAEEHQAIGERIYNSMRKEKEKIVENVAELAYRNIIDTRIWSKVFAEATELRFVELQGYPKVETLFENMEMYLRKFNPELYKFTLDEVELLGLFTMRDKCTEALKKRENISGLRVENKIISLYGAASSRVPVGIKHLREYYDEKIVKNLETILKNQTDVALITELEAVLDPFHLARKKTRKIFTNRILEIFETGDVNIGEENYMVMAKNWATFGKLRQCYSDLFPKVFESLVNQYPVMMLQILVCCDIDQPELIDRTLKIISSMDLEDLHQKSKVHLLLHVLATREHDLKNHTRLVNTLCKSTCQKIRYDINQSITSPVSSECMQVTEERRNVLYPPVTQKWITNTIKNEVVAHENQQFIYFTKICQYFVLFGVIKNKKMHVLTFSDLHIALNRPKQPRSMIKIQEELFAHYGIQTLELKKTQKYLKEDITKSNKKMLVEAVEEILTTI